MTNGKDATNCAALGGMVLPHRAGLADGELGAVALNGALPRVKSSMDLDNLIVFILQSQGGGELEVAVPGTDARIEIQAHRFEDGGGSSARYGSQNVTEKNLRRAAELCRDILKERYPDLR